MKRQIACTVLISLILSLPFVKVSAAPPPHFGFCVHGSYALAVPLQSVPAWKIADSLIKSEKPAEVAQTPFENSSVETLIGIAQSKLGSRYVRGGKGPNSFDCSGFVYWCLNQAGVDQPYWTSERWKGGDYVKIKDMTQLQRGDILVYTGHVGIYIGNGRMISALNRAKGVCVSGGILDSPYRINRFVCAYRIF